MEITVKTMPAKQVPQSSEGFYNVDNPFQISGPKGFREVKLLANRDIYVRNDLPGVGEDDTVDVRIDRSKRSVILRTLVESHFLYQSYYPDSFKPRSYAIPELLMCSCCNISRFTHTIKDGVLRLVISTTPKNNEERENFCRAGHPMLSDTDPNARSLTGPTPSTGRPFLVQGEGNGAYEFNYLPEGCAYVRLDMPGVPKDKFKAEVIYGNLKANKRSRAESTVIVTGTAPAVDQDSGERKYYAIAAVVYDSMGAILLESDPGNGVMKLTIRPS